MLANALNRLTVLPSNSACVSLHLNERIMRQLYYARRKMASESGRQLDPPLSSVHTPRFEIGQAAARALLQALQSGRAAADERLPWTLIARGSS